MKITTVNYQKVFPLGQYINERIGVEIQVDPDESEVEALREAKRIVEQFHKDNNPQLYTETPIVDYNNFSATNVHSAPDKEEEIQVPESPEEGARKLIESSVTLKGLSFFKPLTTKYPNLKEIYDNKLKELTEN